MSRRFLVFPFYRVVYSRVPKESNSLGFALWLSLKCPPLHCAIGLNNLCGCSFWVSAHYVLFRAFGLINTLKSLVKSIKTAKDMTKKISCRWGFEFVIGFLRPRSISTPELFSWLRERRALGNPETKCLPIGFREEQWTASLIGAFVLARGVSRRCKVQIGNCWL